MVKTAVVLGASGNIGKLLVPYLTAKGYKVRAVGRTKPSFKDVNVENLAADYDSQDSLNKVTAEADYIFMLIGLEYTTKIWQAQWPSLTKRIIEATKNSKAKLIFFDNVYAYGLTEGAMTETSPMNAETKKGLVRKEIDELLLKAIETGEIKAIIAKSADFYGPEIATSVIGDRFFNLILTKDTFEWFGNPDKLHNYTFVSDISPALEALAASNFVGNIHLPTSKPMTGHEFKILLEKLTGKTLKLSPLRQSTAWWLGLFMPILRELHEMMYQSENDYNFNSDKFESMFENFHPTSYEIGFKETLDWYKENQK